MSRSDPIANERWSKDSLLALNAPPADEWSVREEGARKVPRGGGGKGRRGRRRGDGDVEGGGGAGGPPVFVPIVLSAEGVDGAGLIATLQRWMRVTGVARSRGRLHSRECREHIAAAFADTEKVSVLLFTVTFHANLAHSLTRSPSHL